MKGKLKWYNRVKGYGFVCADGTDYFFHHTDFAGGRDVRETLHEKDGADVEFDAGTGERGAKAINVRLVEAPAQ